jgi:hypothetical protein
MNHHFLLPSTDVQIHRNFATPLIWLITLFWDRHRVRREERKARLEAEAQAQEAKGNDNGKGKGKARAQAQDQSQTP